MTASLDGVSALCRLFSVARHHTGAAEWLRALRRRLHRLRAPLLAHALVLSLLQQQGWHSCCTPSSGCIDAHHANALAATIALHSPARRWWPCPARGRARAATTAQALRKSACKLARLACGRPGQAASSLLMISAEAGTRVIQACASVNSPSQCNPLASAASSNQSAGTWCTAVWCAGQRDTRPPPLVPDVQTGPVAAGAWGVASMHRRPDKPGHHLGSAEGSAQAGALPGCCAAGREPRDGSSVQVGAYDAWWRALRAAPSVQFGQLGKACAGVLVGGAERALGLRAPGSGCATIRLTRAKTLQARRAGRAGGACLAARSDRTRSRCGARRPRAAQMRNAWVRAPWQQPLLSSGAGRGQRARTRGAARHAGVSGRSQTWHIMGAEHCACDRTGTDCGCGK